MIDLKSTKEIESDSKMVWIDLEMTGLDPLTHTITEIAVVITDSDLNILAKGPDIVVHQPESEIKKMDRRDAVMDEFFTSGFVDKVRESKISLNEAEKQVLTFLKKHLTKDEAPLCGKAIYVDRMFLLIHMSKIVTFLHHKNIDVTTIKELYIRWHEDPEPYKKNTPHRAMDDILDSIEELKYYREKFLKG